MFGILTPCCTKIKRHAGTWFCPYPLASFSYTLQKKFEKFKWENGIIAVGNTTYFRRGDQLKKFLSFSCFICITEAFSCIYRLMRSTETCRTSSFVRPRSNVRQVFLTSSTFSWLQWAPSSRHIQFDHFLHSTRDEGFFKGFEIYASTDRHLAEFSRSSGSQHIKLQTKFKTEISTVF